MQSYHSNSLRCLWLDACHLRPLLKILLVYQYTYCTDINHMIFMPKGWPEICGAKCCSLPVLMIFSFIYQYKIIVLVCLHPLWNLVWKNGVSPNYITYQYASIQLFNLWWEWEDLARTLRILGNLARFKVCGGSWKDLELCSRCTLKFLPVLSSRLSLKLYKCMETLSLAFRPKSVQSPSGKSCWNNAAS